MRCKPGDLAIVVYEESMEEWAKKYVGMPLTVISRCRCSESCTGWITSINVDEEDGTPVSFNDIHLMPIRPQPIDQTATEREKEQCE